MITQHCKPHVRIVIILTSVLAITASSQSITPVLPTQALREVGNGQNIQSILIPDFQISENVGFPDGPVTDADHTAIASNGTKMVSIWSSTRNGPREIFARFHNVNGIAEGNIISVIDAEYYKTHIPTNPEPTIPSIAVAVRNSGEFVVAWAAKVDKFHGVFFRTFDANGVATGPVRNAGDPGYSAPTRVSVGFNQSNHIVLAWDWSRISARIFQWDGTPVTNKTDLVTFSTTATSLAIRGAHLVAVWTEYNASKYFKFYRRFDASTLQPVNLTTMLMTDSTSSVKGIGIACNSSGELAFTWMGNTVASKYGVRLTRISSSGAILQFATTIWEANGSVPDIFEVPLAMDETGSCAIAWKENLILRAQRLEGNGTPQGSAILVDSVRHQLNNGSMPAITIGNSGTAVMIYDERNFGFSQIYHATLSSGGTLTNTAQRIDTNTGNGSEIQPSCALFDDGSFVVAWTDGRDGISSGNQGPDKMGVDIFLQRFDPSGLKVGTNEKVNTAAGQWAQRHSEIASNTSKQFAISWSDSRRQSIDTYMRAYSASGQSAGPETVAPTADPGSGMSNSFDHGIAMDQSGKSIVAFTDSRGGFQATQIWGRYFTANSQPAGNDFNISNKFYRIAQVRCAMDANGNAMIVWADTLNGKTIFMAQRRNSSGNPEGNNFRLGSDTCGIGNLFRMAMTGNGNFVIVWIERPQSNCILMARLFDATGNPRSGKLRIADIGTPFAETNGSWASNTRLFSVAMDESGRFVVAWVDYGWIIPKIYAKQFSSTGDALSGAYRVSNAGEHVWQIAPDTRIRNGKILTVWMDNRTPNHGFDIYANVIGTITNPFEPDNTAPVASIIQYGDTVKASIETDTDVDYFKFLAAKSDTISIGTTNAQGSLLDGKLWLFDESGTQLAMNDDDQSSASSRIEYRIQAAGWYYIRYAEKNNSGSFPGIRSTEDQAQSIATSGAYSLTLQRRGYNPEGMFFTVSDGQDKLVLLMWKSMKGKLYRFYRREGENGNFELLTTVIGEINATFFPDTTVTNGTKYYYLIVAVEDGIEMRISTIREATPRAGGHRLSIPKSVSSPTVDGVLSSPEWSDAAVVDITNKEGYYGLVAQLPVALKMKHDGQTLFFGIEDVNLTNTGANDGVRLYLDKNNDRAWSPAQPSNEGEYRFYDSTNGTGTCRIDFLGISGSPPSNIKYDPRVVFPQGVTGKISTASGHLSFEGSITLGAEGLNLPPGSTFGLCIMTISNSPFRVGGFWPNGSSTLFPATFAYATLSTSAGNKPPTISSKSPTASNINAPRNVNQSFSVSASDPDNDPLTYTWKINDTTQTGATASNATLKFTRLGSYSVKCIVSDGTESIEAAWTVQSINSKPSITSRNPSSPTLSVQKNAQQNFSVSASDQNGDALSYIWKKDGAVQSPTSSSAQFLFDQVGSFVISCEVRDGLEMEIASWTVNVVEGKPVITSRTPDKQNDTIDVRSEKTFSVTASSSGGSLTYIWLIDGIENARGAQSQFTSKFDFGGDVTVACIVTNASGTDSTRWNLFVNHAPKILASLPTKNPDTLTIGSNRTFSIVVIDSNGTTPTIIWRVNDAETKRGTETQYTHTFSQLGSYRITSIATDGVRSDSARWTIVVKQQTSVEEAITPDQIWLSQNYPNPFTHSTSIAFHLSKSSHVTLEVLDLFGRKITTLVDEEKESGRHTVSFKASALPAGLYIYRLSTMNQSLMRIAVVRK